MQIYQDAATQHSDIRPAAERRRRPRIHTPFPATVRGSDAGGRVFRSRTTIDNISDGGLYLRLMPCLQPGTKLSVLIQISNAQTPGETTLRLRLDGEVLRIEPKPGGACGIAMVISHKRFV